MNDCIFCKIIKGELPSKTIYEDDLIKVIMNINPSTNGHLLVLPKEHCENILDIKEEVVTHSFKIIKNNLHKKLLVDLCKMFKNTNQEIRTLDWYINHFI